MSTQLIEVKGKVYISTSIIKEICLVYLQQCLEYRPGYSLKQLCMDLMWELSGKNSKKSKEVCCDFGKGKSFLIKRILSGGGYNRGNLVSNRLRGVQVHLYCRSHEYRAVKTLVIAPSMDFLERKSI